MDSFLQKRLIGGLLANAFIFFLILAGWLIFYCLGSHGENLHPIKSLFSLSFKLETAKNAVSGQNLYESIFVYPQTFFVNDWIKELGYIEVLKNALIEKKLPLYVSGFEQVFHLGEGKFFGVPIYPLLPSTPFLIWMSPLQFHFLNHFIFLFIGLHGCSLFKRRYNLNFQSYFFLCMTFNFYGGFFLKMAAYGPSQLGYYLSLHIIYLLLNLPKLAHEGGYQKGWVFPAGMMALCLSGVMFAGSLHSFVEWVTFILFFCVFNYKFFKFFLVSGFFTIGICAMRLLPAAFVFRDKGNTHLVDGYNFDPEFFLTTFITTRHIGSVPAYSWWEYSNYMTYVGFTLVIFFGLWVYANDSLKKERLPLKPLIIPIVLTILVSFENIHEYVVPGFIPLLNAESLTTKFMFIPSLFLIVIATLNFNQFSRDLSYKPKIFIGGALFIHYLYFMYAAVIWRMAHLHSFVFHDPKSADELNTLRIHDAVSLSPNYYEGDIFYDLAAKGGIALTLVSLICVLCFLALGGKTVKAT